MLLICHCLRSWRFKSIAVRLLCPWDSPGKNTGVGCHFLLQGIFPTQESNPCLLYCRWILYHSATRECAKIKWNLKKKKEKNKVIQGLVKYWWIDNEESQSCSLSVVHLCPFSLQLNFNSCRSLSLTRTERGELCCSIPRRKELAPSTPRGGKRCEIEATVYNEVIFTSLDAA